MVFVYAIAVLLLTEFIDLISAVGLILQGHLLPAIDFVFRHNDCFFDIALLSTVSNFHCHSSIISRAQMFFA
jgi:hypothetical protein